LTAVSFERDIQCPDFARRFDGFLDGEVDAHSLRAMAAHASHCDRCGAELEGAESLQELLLRAVEDETDRVDAGALWRRVESRLEPAMGSVLSRWSRFADWRWAPAILPAVGGVLAAALALLLWPVAISNRHAWRTITRSRSHRVERTPRGRMERADRAYTAIWVASYDSGTPHVLIPRTSPGGAVLGVATLCGRLALADSEVAGDANRAATDSGSDFDQRLTGYRRQLRGLFINPYRLVKDEERHCPFGSFNNFEIPGALPRFCPWR
jgi:hypothetical protein